MPPADDDRELALAEMPEDWRTYERGPFDVEPHRQNPFPYVDLDGQAYSIEWVRLGPRAKPPLLLLHGHSSSVHEFDDLYWYLQSDFDVFSIDMPNCGKSSDLPIEKVEAYAAHHAYPHNRCALYYLRDLIISFVQQVVVPAHPGRQVHIAGGSLGANLALWIGSLQPSPAWLDRISVWSPGCGWPFDDIGRSLAGQTASVHAQKRNWSRDDFLESAYGQPALFGVLPQPYYWYWDCWSEWAGDPTKGPSPCTRTGIGSCPRCAEKPAGVPDAAKYPSMGRRKKLHIEGAYKTIRDQFTNARAIWHWNIAAETMTSSFHEPVGAPLVNRIAVPTTFLAGMKDSDGSGGLYPSTRLLHQTRAAAGLPSRGRWLPQTGHSVHNERPLTLTAILTRKI